MAFPRLLARPCYPAAFSIFALLLFLNAQQAWAQDHSMHHDHGGHEGMSMSMDAAQQGKLLSASN
jgi:hypothetical protein